jgi:hypothetical protein
MTSASITRETASRLNPIISPVGRNDTISQCAHLVESLGVFVSTSDAADDSRCHLHLLTGSIDAALNFELAARECSENTSHELIKG